MSKYKQGSTIRVLLTDMSDAEWEFFTTADEIRAECRVSTRNGSEDVTLNVSINYEDKVIEISRLVDNSLPVGTYLMDIAVTRDGETVFIPLDSYFTFSVINAITGAYL